MRTTLKQAMRGFLRSAWDRDQTWLDISDGIRQGVERSTEGGRPRRADRQAKGGKGKKPKPKGESQCHVWPSLFLVSGLGAQT